VNIIKKIKKLFKRDKRPDFIKKYDKYTDDELKIIARKERETANIEVGKDGRVYRSGPVGAAARALAYRGILEF